MKLLTSRHFQPRKVLYRYVRLTDTSEHERVLKCKPQFNQECNCIVFGYEDLLFPVIGYNKDLSETFTGLLNEAMQKDEYGAGFIAAVNKVILQNFQFRFPSLEDIADRMHITVRTLQRRLQEEGTSFRELSDTIKQELALQLLRNKLLPVAEIAYKLGYTEASSFQRAFRQWTGKTPLEFRNEL